VENRISSKLIDNSILLMGIAVDVIAIDETLNGVQDVTALDVNSIKIVNIIFPSAEDIPMRRFLNSTGTYLSANDGKTEKEPFICYAPISQPLNQGTILLRFFENPTGSENWILPLKISDVLGTFGSRTIQWNKILAVYYDTPINSTLLGIIEQLAARRELLTW
jgi:hypothetical protein